MRPVTGALRVAALLCVQVWDASEADWIFLPASGRWQRKASATNTDRLSSLQSEFAAALEEMKRQAERAHKLESKARVLRVRWHLPCANAWVASHCSP